MATLKHEKMKKDAHDKMLENGILKILAQLDSIEGRLTQLESIEKRRLTKQEAKPKPKGGRNV